jgi:dihydroxy-acid dehydratase
MDGQRLDPKHNSRQLTEGPARAAARSYLHGIGFDKEALAKPIIGVASTWTETMPCNFGLRALAAKVKEGIRAAGGTPMEFNTIAISDGITMGTSGMKTSLVSREVVADSIELVARGHLFDGIVALVACDKTIPGAAMALARLDVPGVLLYGGSILPGHYNGHDVTIQEVFEAVGAHAAGKITDAELHEIEEAASPGVGACGGQFTANTMAMAFEVLGLSPMGSAMVPAAYEDKNRVATEAGALIMDVLARGQRPRDIITRAGLENAIAAIATSGGSTNGVLHLLALAREAGVQLDIDDFDRIAARTPTTCDLKPGGRFVAKDLYEAGGVAVVAKRADGHRQDDRRARARGRGDAGPRGRAAARRPGEEDRRSRDPARQPRAGGLRREAVRPRAHPPQRTGARVRVRGGRDGGRDGRHDRRRRRGRDPQRGPGRRAGDA